jgi:hypothetical protein
LEAYIITEVHQLNELLSSNRKVNFTFAFTDLSEEENKRWLTRIKKNYFACGCDTGMHFMMGSLFFILLLLAIDMFFIHKSIHYSIYFYTLLFVFAMAGAGKMIGKAKAYRQLKKDIKALKILIMEGEDISSRKFTAKFPTLFREKIA